MKKLVSIICLSLLLCLVLSSCTEKSGINIGFDGIRIGRQPDVYFGVKSDKTEFDINDVTLEFSYGNGSSSEAGGYIGNYVEGDDMFEECPITCIAVYFFNSKYSDTVFDIHFDDHKNIEGLYFVKEISLADYNENYDVENNIFGTEYEHSEVLTIPNEAMEKTTGYVCFGVFEVAYVPSEDRYCFGGHCGYQALEYEKLDDNTVRISKPSGSYYYDPE